MDGDSPSGTPGPVPGRLSLLFDADDTLWENNVLFEQAADEFVTFLDHQELSPEEVRDFLEEIGRQNRTTHGYGARSFARSLRDTFARLVEIDEGDPRVEHVERLGLRILTHEIELIQDVLPTLVSLRPLHDLYLLTKGDLEEQQIKVQNSGIDHLFDAVLISSDKTTATFVEAIDSLDLEPQRTWMIGNSPRSDVNPALAAGINAVFIPHSMTWRQEVEDLVSDAGYDGMLVEISAFAQLRALFPGG